MLLHCLLVIRVATAKSDEKGDSCFLFFACLFCILFYLLLLCFESYEYKTHFFSKPDVSGAHFSGVNL